MKLLPVTMNLGKPIDQDVLRKKAVQFLSRRAYTVAGLTDRLASWWARQIGAPVDRSLCESVVRSLVERGFLDDHDFARAWLASRRSKSWGLHRKRAELLRLGVPAEIADALLEEEAAAGYEEEIAFSALKRRMTSDVLRERQRTKVAHANWLKSKGFTSRAIKHAFSRMAKEQGASTILDENLHES